MKPSLLDIICCPDCYERFQLVHAMTQGVEIISGSLLCLACRCAYPIVEGLPIILNDIRTMRRTQHAFSAQWLWQEAGYFERTTTYGRTDAERWQQFLQVFDIPVSTGLAGTHILDAGCGSGQLVQQIGRCAPDATVVGFDISAAAGAAYRRCAALPNTHILQCDLLHPPFRPTSFDYTWSEGVIHHTPSSFQSFVQLDRLLAPGGQLYVWVYPNYRTNCYALARTILWRPYLLPPSVRYMLAWLCGLLLYCCSHTPLIWRLSGQERRLRTAVFCFFDNLTPEFQHTHSKEEVHDWFHRCNYAAVKLTGDIGAVGYKQRYS